MKKILLFLLLTIPALAQSRFEAGGGYSLFYQHSSGAESHGWAGNFAYNPNSYFGLAVDTNGQYGDTKIHGIHAGPRLSLRRDNFSLFGHVMFGSLRNDYTYTTITTDIPQTLHTHSSSASTKAGLGFDIRLKKHLSWRTQGDYYLRQPHNIQLSSGLVFDF